MSIEELLLDTGKSLENEMTDFDTPRYGMFTDEGNKRVDAIVTAAKAKKWDLVRVEQELYKLAYSDAQLFSEATDTAVRETVYTTLGY